MKGFRVSRIKEEKIEDILFSCVGLDKTDIIESINSPVLSHHGEGKEYLAKAYLKNALKEVQKEAKKYLISLNKNYCWVRLMLSHPNTKMYYVELLFLYTKNLNGFLSKSCYIGKFDDPFSEEETKYCDDIQIPPSIESQELIKLIPGRSCAILMYLVMNGTVWDFAITSVSS